MYCLKKKYERNFKKNTCWHPVSLCIMLFVVDRIPKTNPFFDMTNCKIHVMKIIL